MRSRSCGGFWVGRGGGSRLIWLWTARPGGKDVKHALEGCTCDASGGKGVDDLDLGLVGGEDSIELVNDKFDTINRFLRFLFQVFGESSVLNIKSSSEASSLVTISLQGSSSAAGDLGLASGEETMELVKETLATVYLFLRFCFQVRGESSELKIRSLADSLSVCVASMSLVDSSFSSVLVRVL